MRPRDLGIGGVFESVRDALFVAEANTGRVVLWNAAATEVFGYSASEALDLRIEALVPELLEARYRVGLDIYRDTDYSGFIDSTAPLNLPAVRKDGGEIIIEMSLSPIDPAGGTAVGGRFVLAIVRDVTERTRKEEALREAEGRFRSAFDNAPIGVAIVGLEGRFVQVNRSLGEMLGYSEGELAATTFLKITYPDDGARKHGSRAPCDGGRDRQLLSGGALRGSGRPMWVSLSVSLVRDAVRANSQRMGLLIDDLLSLSRVTRSEMLRTTVDLSALAESVVDELRQGDPERQVQFRDSERDGGYRGCRVAEGGARELVG